MVTDGCRRLTMSTRRCWSSGLLVLGFCFGGGRAEGGGEAGRGGEE